MSNESLEAIRGEVSGAAAKRTVRELAQFHRVQASEGYRRAAGCRRENLRPTGFESLFAALACIERCPRRLCARRD
jgi:hypothetical protein